MAKPDGNFAFNRASHEALSREANSAAVDVFGSNNAATRLVDGEKLLHHQGRAADFVASLTVSTENIVAQLLHGVSVRHGDRPLVRLNFDRRSALATVSQILRESANSVHDRSRVLKQTLR